MKKYRYNRIPTKLSEDDFNEFILPHLSKGKRGKPTKLSYYKIFHYILKFLHTGWVSGVNTKSCVSTHC